MNRILVTGNTGSGKSTLAKLLGQKLGIEVFGLDAIVWQAGWKKTPELEKNRKIRNLTSKNKWIVDGVSMHVLEKADTVIFLDFPLHVCYMRAFKRHLKYLFHSRPGLPDNCPEILIMKRQIQIMWRFNNKYKEELLVEMKKVGNEKNIYLVRSKQQLVSLLNNL